MECPGKGTGLDNIAVRSRRHVFLGFFVPEQPTTIRHISKARTVTSSQAIHTVKTRESSIHSRLEGKPPGGGECKDSNQWEQDGRTPDSIREQLISVSVK